MSQMLGIFFQTDDIEGYNNNISNHILKIYKDYDSIALAQASMDQVPNHLNALDIPIYSSPKLGVDALIAELKS